MSPAQSTFSRSRFLALALLMIFAILIYWLLIAPLLTRYLETRSEIQQLEHQLQVYRRVASELQDNRTKLQELRAAAPVTDIYLRESKPSLAAAQLQQMINSMISRTGGQLVSTGINNLQQNTPLQAVSIKVHLRTEITDLVKVLYAIEHSRPVLFTDDLVIRSTIRTEPNTVVTSRGKAKSRIRARVPTLDVQFNVTAYTLAEGI
ncbi:type II secretion system protein GspM [Aliamphritea hakodatensis]|uniref:type II secretion system protein GspM n=1 Tax=Aliamphritea hakodatensis TaxID=2895352 RepID=UPI0022FD5CD9|nr:type II secretion system protein GspM [Aliamphritea hakodatensis]